MNSRIIRVLLLLGRLALAGVLLYAVYAKINNPAGTFASFDSLRWQLAIGSFGIAIANYQVLPPSVTETVAYAVIIIETILGLWLLTGIGLRWSASGAAAMLGFFFALMLHAYSRGLVIDCGCFGPGDTLGPKTLARDGLLLAMAIAVAAIAWWKHRANRRALEVSSEASPVLERSVKSA